MPPTGIEPVTLATSVPRSPSWAIEADDKVVQFTPYIHPLFSRCSQQYSSLRSHSEYIAHQTSTAAGGHHSSLLIHSGTEVLDTGGTTAAVHILLAAQYFQQKIGGVDTGTHIIEAPGTSTDYCCWWCAYEIASILFTRYIHCNAAPRICVGVLFPSILLN